jgi:hypothetical protein
VAAPTVSAVLLGAASLIAGCGRLHFDPSAGDAASGDGRPSDVRGDALPAGPIALWKLDEGTGTVAIDSIGGLVGTLQSGAALDPVWVPGHIGTALSFTGDGDAVSLGTPALLNNLPVVSVAAWVVPTSTFDDGQSHCIFDKGELGIGWAINLMADSDGDISFRASFVNADLVVTSAGGVLVPGTGKEVVVTWDGSPSTAGVHIYTGGTEVPYGISVPGSGTWVNDSTVDAWINCNANTSFAGVIDEVALYDRVLTPFEIGGM